MASSSSESHGAMKTLFGFLLATVPAEEVESVTAVDFMLPSTSCLSLTVVAFSTPDKSSTCDLVKRFHIRGGSKNWANRTFSARTSHELFQLRIICTSLVSKGKTQYLLHVEIEQAPVIKLHRRRPVPESPAGCRLGLFRSLF